MEDHQFNILLTRLSAQDDKLDALHGDFREFKGTAGNRLDQIEKDGDKDEMWTNIKLLVIVPVIGVLHQIASHFGWIK